MGASAGQRLGLSGAVQRVDDERRSSNGLQALTKKLLELGVKPHQQRLVRVRRQSA